MQQPVQSEFLIETPEMVKIYVEVATRLMIASMTEDRVVGFYPDEAVNLAADMVGYAMSDAVIGRLRAAHAAPESVATSINKQMAIVLDRLSKVQVGSTQRAASIYAKAFGVGGAAPIPKA